MARNIDSASAKKIVKTYKAFLNHIDTVCSYADGSAEDVIALSREVIRSDAHKALQNIPVDELNRDKKGFRIKTLKDNGYNTIADIEDASVAQLSGINGISSMAIPLNILWNYV